MQKPEPWELARLEYEVALEHYRQLTSLRRQDMAFVTTAQVAILTIIGTRLLNLDMAGFLLSLIAVFVLFLGINSERRLSLYMSVYMQRAKEIESDYGMQLLSLSAEELKNQKLLLSNAVVFPLYYACLSGCLAHCLDPEPRLNLFQIWFGMTGLQMLL